MTCPGNRVREAAKAAWGDGAWGGVMEEAAGGTFGGYAYSTPVGQPGVGVDISGMSSEDACADVVIAAIAAVGAV